MRQLYLGFAAAVTVCLLSVAVPTADSARVATFMDKCDPATFNQAIGPGTCVGDGNVTFAEFLEQLNPVDFGHDAWRTQFGRGRLDRGESLIAVNRGGELHTFTRVAEFGGGCVPDLNTPLNLSPVAECNNPDAFTNTAVPAGSSRQVPRGGPGGLARGINKIQCLVHPWMRVEVDVR